MCQDPIPRRQETRTEEGVQGLVLESRVVQRKKDLSVNPDEN